MTDKLFVFPNHELHKEVRRIASTCPLIIRWQDHVIYDFNKLDISAKEFVSDGLVSRAQWKFNIETECPGGINLANRDMETRFRHPLRQVGYRMAGMHLSSRYDFNYPTAFEVLCFGVGIMRPLNPPHSSFHVVMGGDGLPMVSSEHLKADYALVYQERSRGSEKPENYCWKMQMTNLLFADTYGELEQLSKADDKILRVYLTNMKFMYERAKEEAKHPCSCLDPLWQQHLSKGQWESPPKNITELHKRIAFILQNTFVDDNPMTILKLLEYGEGMLHLAKKENTLRIV